MIGRILLSYFLSTFYFYNVEGAACFTANVDPSSALTVVSGNVLIYKYISTGPAKTCTLTGVDESALLSEDYTFSASDTNGSPITQLNSFSFGDSSFKTMSVTVTTVNDADGVEKFLISLDCDVGSGCPTIFTEVTIAAAGSGGGDPHFFQTVSDLNTGKFFDICYDVIGQSGQVIDIFFDKNSKVAVKGQLFDDYFMHRMLIFYPKFNITFEKTGCFVNGIFLTDWETKERSPIIKVNNFSIKKSRNQIDILSDDYLQFHISVFKKAGPYGNFYLDVAVAGLGYDYTDQDGLLGKMGKAKFELFRAVQTDSITGIKINGIQRSASKLIRNGKECLLINVADGLYPKSISDYVK